MSSFRRLFIWLRYFWVVVPALAVALFMGWLFWGLGPLVGMMVGVGTGFGMFVALAMVGAAWGR